VYSGDVLRVNAGAMVELLAEAATASTFRSYHIDEIKEHAFAEAVEAKATSTQSLLLEGLHAAAYGGSARGLGRRLWAEEGDMAALSSEALSAHAAASFSAPRAVLAAYNVDHAALVEAAGRYLGGPPSGSGAPGTAGAAPGWRGGEHHVRAARGEPLVSMALAFPAPPAGSSPSGAAAAVVLSALLGGTSLRGPNRPGFGGLSRYALLAGVPPGGTLRAFYLPGSDAGMLGLWASVPAEGPGGGVEGVAELVGSASRAARGGAGGEELARAKAAARLRAAVLYEEREARRGALGSAALRGAGGGVSLGEELAAIDKVSGGDVAALAAQAFKSAPAVAAISGEDFPTYAAVKELL
jgi:predicted Zn-dependent peptidase